MKEGENGEKLQRKKKENKDKKEEKKFHGKGIKKKTPEKETL